jgi:4'-phosphopantetheinyl transferase
MMAEEKQIYVLYSKIPENLPEDIYKRCLIFLTDSLRDKHFRYRRWQDRAANLFSKVLLIQGLQKYGIDHRALENLQYTEYGRPYLSGTIDFNISHSGKYIICAIGEGLRLGVDIEQIKPVDFSDFHDLMSEEQWTLIRNASEPFTQFFTFWAIKESIIKADGRGLNIPLNDIMITEEMAYYESRWYLKKLEIDEGYRAWLASNRESAVINVEFVDLGMI